jgi:hypothetical protein
MLNDLDQNIPLRQSVLNQRFIPITMKPRIVRFDEEPAPITDAKIIMQKS